MATISDVENALQALIYAPLYPNGAPPSVLGFRVKIYAGWPDAGTVDEDMVETAPDTPTAGHVAIFPPPGSERNTTRYPSKREEGAIPATTYTLTAVGQVVTVGGAAPNPYFAQNLAVFVNGKPYVVGAAAGKTAAQLATALRALIVADVAGVTVAGAVITLPGTAILGALRVGSTGSTTREVRRQEKRFDLIVLSSSPASRAAIGDAFDVRLADTRFLSLADGTGGRLRYVGTREDDYQQKQRIYRRWITYTVEYATTVTEAAAQMVAGQTDEVVPGPLTITSYV